MPDLKLPDVSYHYEVEGSGPPLLLLPGMLSDSATFGAFAPLLTDSYTVIRPDNRSAGRTTPWDAPTSIALMAQDAIALMEHLGHARFHVAGHSMGGLLAMEIAGKVPDRVASATVLTSGRVRLPRTVGVFDALLAVRRGPDGERLWLRALYPWIFGQAFFDTPGKVEQAMEAALAYPFAQTADAMAHQVETFRNLRPSVEPASLSCPVLVVYAGQDLLVPPEAARPGFSVIPDLTEVTLDHAGHSVHWDAPQELAEHMRAFLAAHPL